MSDHEKEAFAQLTADRQEKFRQTTREKLVIMPLFTATDYFLPGFKGEPTLLARICILSCFVTIFAQLYISLTKGFLLFITACLILYGFRTERLGHRATVFIALFLVCGMAVLSHLRYMLIYPEANLFSLVQYIHFGNRCTHRAAVNAKCSADDVHFSAYSVLSPLRVCKQLCYPLLGCFLCGMLRADRT
jgi:hypothetical protein